MESPKLPQTAPPWRASQAACALPWDNAYFRQAPARVFWALISHGTQQQTGASCSVATAAVVLNALGWLSGGHTSKFWSEGRLLRKVGDEDWLAATIEGGVGISLPAFAERMAKCLLFFNPDWTLELVHASENNNLEQKLKTALVRMEQKADTVVIGNFHHGTLYKNDDDDGHYSPIGAYDEATDRVLVLDVYNDYPPTWVNFKDFIAAISACDSQSGKSRGFLELRLKK